MLVEAKFSSRRISILAGMILGLFAAVNGLADEAQFAEGEELYGEFCENCHGANRDGLKAFDGDLDELTERLEGFTEEMPDFAGFFEEDEIAALHAYLSAPK
jgi:mono/diheme cytochrome c family protein